MATLDLRNSKLDLRVTAGKDWDLTVTMPTGWNWTGYTATWTIASASGTAVITATVGDGITLAGLTMTVHIPAADTTAVAVGRYTHELTIIAPGGAEPPFIDGIVTVG